MAGTAPTSRITRTFVWTAGVALALAAATSLRAQPCNGSLDQKATDAVERYSMISAQCGALAVPMTVHRAAQLDLYDRPPVVAAAAPAASAPPAAASAPTANAAVPPLLAPALKPGTPPSRDAARILSLAPALTEVAREHQLDPLLLHAIAHVESRHNPRAVSRAGARGVMQVMPATGKRFGVTNPEHSLLDATTNLRASAAYLRTLRQRYGDDLRLMLAAYNAGEGAVAKAGHNVPPYPETQAYVRDVLAVYRRLTSTFTFTAGGQLVAKGTQP